METGVMSEIKIMNMMNFLLPSLLYSLNNDNNAICGVSSHIHDLIVVCEEMLP